jgi:hypothetical protein
MTSKEIVGQACESHALNCGMQLFSLILFSHFCISPTLSIILVNFYVGEAHINDQLLLCVSQSVEKIGLVISFWFCLFV